MRRWEVFFEPKKVLYGFALQTPDTPNLRRFWTFKSASRYLGKVRSSREGGSAGEWVMRKRRRSE